MSSASSVATHGAKTREAPQAIASPKLGLIFGPWEQTELYLDAGMGYHSNDARGVTAHVEPGTDPPVPIAAASPLVRTQGAEIGLRSGRIRNLQSTVAFWWLDIASELLFVGDAGTTEPSRPSRRYGVEWTNLYTPTDWLALDADRPPLAVGRDHDPWYRRQRPDLVGVALAWACTAAWPVVCAVVPGAKCWMTLITGAGPCPIAFSIGTMVPALRGTKNSGPRSPTM